MHPITKPENNMKPLDTIVIGAGISGLTAAYGLTKRSRTCTVLDPGPEAGGVIASRRRDGFLYEMGPNSTLDTRHIRRCSLRPVGRRILCLPRSSPSVRTVR